MQSLGQELPSLHETNKVVPGLDQNCIPNLYTNAKSWPGTMLSGWNQQRIISGVARGKYFSWKEGYLSALVSSWKVSSHEWKLSATIIVVAHACSYLIPQFLS
jgi:hypothetical protein